jgi:predicted DNA-binding transcriptional regulator AlpA
MPARYERPGPYSSEMAINDGRIFSVNRKSFLRVTLRQNLTNTGRMIRRHDFQPCGRPTEVATAVKAGSLIVILRRTNKLAGFGWGKERQSAFLSFGGESPLDLDATRVEFFVISKSDTRVQGSGMSPKSVCGESESRLLSCEDLAQLLGVTTRTVMRYVKAQRLPSPVRIGKFARWHPDAGDRRLVVFNSAVAPRHSPIATKG